MKAISELLEAYPDADVHIYKVDGSDMITIDLFWSMGMEVLSQNVDFNERVFSDDSIVVSVLFQAINERERIFMNKLK